MSAVVRLVTLVDLDDRAGSTGEAPSEQAQPAQPSVGAAPGRVPYAPGPTDEAREIAFTAVQWAVLDDGRRLVLLADRGWSVSGPPDIWQYTSAEEIEADARTVVGPDEPFGNRTAADMAGDHWAALAGVLRRQGIAVDPDELRRLPQKVQFSDRLQARLDETDEQPLS